MKTNIFHSQRQASCDVLFYPITSVFLYSSDVTRPGGFRKNIYKERNRGKKENPYDVMQPLLKLNMRFQTTRCDSADVKNNNRAIGLKHSWTTLLWAFCSLNKLHWWVHLCKKKKKVWAHFIAGTHATQSKHEETGSKNKNKLVLRLFGGVHGITHRCRSLKVTRFWKEKPIWRNLWHRGAEYQVTLRLYFFHKCQLWKC